MGPPSRPMAACEEDRIRRWRNVAGTGPAGACLAPERAARPYPMREGPWRSCATGYRRESSSAEKYRVAVLNGRSAALVVPAPAEQHGVRFRGTSALDGVDAEPWCKLPARRLDGSDRC